MSFVVVTTAEAAVIDAARALAKLWDPAVPWDGETYNAALDALASALDTADGHKVPRVHNRVKAAGVTA